MEEKKSPLIEFVETYGNVLTTIGALSALFMYFNTLIIQKENVDLTSTLSFAIVLIYALLFILAGSLLNEGLKKKYSGMVVVFCIFLFLIIFLLLFYVILKFQTSFHGFIIAIFLFLIIGLGITVLYHINDQLKKLDKINQKKSYIITFLGFLFLIISFLDIETINKIFSENVVFSFFIVFFLFILLNLSLLFLFKYLPDEIKKLNIK